MSLLETLAFLTLLVPVSVAFVYELSSGLLFSLLLHAYTNVTFSSGILTILFTVNSIFCTSSGVVLLWGLASIVTWLSSSSSFPKYFIFPSLSTSYILPLCTNVVSSISSSSSTFVVPFDVFSSKAVCNLIVITI